MKKRYKVLAEHVEYLEKENEKLQAAINILLAEKAQWVQSKELQEKIIQQTVSGINVKNAAISEEMILLREENRRLKEDVKTLKEE